MIVHCTRNGMMLYVQSARTIHIIFVLLSLRGSFDNGCGPYICDSSFEHSNCLDRFKKYFRSCPPQLILSLLKTRKIQGLILEGSEIMDVRNKDEVALGMKAAIASKQYG
ncbi:hypothetical protein IFM89_025720, partial [Coptis chinensis]